MTSASYAASGSPVREQVATLSYLVCGCQQTAGSTVPEAPMLVQPTQSTVLLDARVL
jgi:hypothetical protein